MPRTLALTFIASMILVGCSSAYAATTTPATLSGTWSGAAKALNYSSTDPKPQRIAATITLTFSQSGSALTAQATFVSVDKSKVSKTLTGTLAGVYGNGNFWILGVTSNVNESQSVILTGHATTKGLKGIGIVFSGANDTEVVYALKPSSAAQAASTLGATSLCGSPHGWAATRAVINVLGKANGKVFTISTSSKPAPLNSAVSGTSTDSGTSKSVTLTISDNTGAETFMLNGPVIGGSLVVFGPNSTNTSQAIFSLHTAKTTAKGIGILYNNGALVELKIGLKQ